MRPRLLVLAIASTGLMACGGFDFDEQTGGDGTRGEAREIQVGPTLDDRLSALQGDNTDWKKFTLTDGGKLVVKFWWDDPSISATVTLRDELGQKLEAMKHAKGQGQDALGPVQVAAGTYYLEIVASEGASVYTYELHLGEGGGTPTPDW